MASRRPFEKRPGRWAETLRRYTCTAESNDAIWRQCSELTDSLPWLKDHRDWVEVNQWGYGDRAFHFLWYMLLTEDVFLKSKSPSLLEIGVFKGQVISLWALIAKHAGVHAQIVGVSPFRGESPGGGFVRRAWRRINPRHRENARAGNLHPDLDYEKCVKGIFDRFHLPMDRVRLVLGLSQDAEVQKRLETAGFDVVYIDGDHRYEAAAADVEFYSRRVNPGGYLVLDDAAWFLPGSAFFKGFESVARAAERVDLARFRNVLNVGHNRVFQRIA